MDRSPMFNRKYHGKCESTSWTWSIFHCICYVLVDPGDSDTFFLTDGVTISSRWPSHCLDEIGFSSTFLVAKTQDQAEGLRGVHPLKIPWFVHCSYQFAWCLFLFCLEIPKTIARFGVGWYICQVLFVGVYIVVVFFFANFRVWSTVTSLL